MRRIVSRLLAGLLAVVLAPALAAADETTFCNAYIRSLPYTITTQGHYCFDRNLSTSMTSGSAITINVDFVLLDLNNFKLGGGGAGLGTNANGINSQNHRNITVRNGNIRGFYVGIALEGGGNYTVENNLLDGNTYIGMSIDGDLVNVHDNVVSNTGGSTAKADAVGIRVAGPTVTNAEHNIVANTFSGTSEAGGIFNYATYGVNDHNVVQMGSAASTKVGIFAYSTAVCRDNTVFAATAGQGLVQCVQVGHNYTNP
jgi:hypothetical protein